MPKKYVIEFEGTPRIATYQEVEIMEGEDWDGRPVSDEWDAADLAYDRLLEDEPDYEWVFVRSYEIEE